MIAPFCIEFSDHGITTHGAPHHHLIAENSAAAGLPVFLHSERYSVFTHKLFCLICMEYKRST
jgi:hypothetical protein